jgi:BirA family biotin operon repressor/biotin-[acetyl-CoA-carboxylase] ligase
MQICNLLNSELLFTLNLRKLDATSSTNKELKYLLKSKKLDSGDAIWTMNQKEGVGQHGSVWKSEPNCHLAFSLYGIFENLNPKWVFTLNCASSIAVLKTLEYFNVPDLSIKWPNDILSGNKKISGILAENQIQKNKISSIIGIGINLFEKSFLELPKATSVYIETRKMVPIDIFIKKLSENLLNFIKICDDSSVKSLSNIYNKKLFFLSKNMWFKNDNKVFRAKINKVYLNGLLELELENSRLKTFQSKQIKWIY